MSYTLIGFDIRKSSRMMFSVDECLWEQNDVLYEDLKLSGISENMAQLLNCESPEIESSVNAEGIGLAIAVSSKGKVAMEQLMGKNFFSVNQSTDDLLKRGWIFQGFDVADVNGFFSIFDMNLEIKLSNKHCLFMNEAEAEEMVPLVDRQYPTHAPFAVFAVFTYEVPI